MTLAVAVQPAADAAPGTVPSAVEAEMEKLRLQLQEAELKAEELEAQQLRAAAAADARRADVRPPHAQPMRSAACAMLVRACAVRLSAWLAALTVVVASLCA